MCGIVGYVGGRSALDVVVDGLARLEYRGYDSAGVAVLADGKLATAKRAGKLVNLRGALEEEPRPPGRSAWGTPGGRRTARRTTATPTRTSTAPAPSR
ncbi:hypothetical protein [Actinomadura luteofluorescens]